MSREGSRSGYPDLEEGRIEETDQPIQDRMVSPCCSTGVTQGEPTYLSSTQDRKQYFRIVGASTQSSGLGSFGSFLLRLVSSRTGSAFMASSIKSTHFTVTSGAT